MHETTKDSRPSVVPFGPGAEAGIRVKESQHMKQEEAIKRAPVPEARMRLQEATSKSTTAAPSNPSSTFKAPRKQVPVVRVVPKVYDPAKDPFATDDLSVAPSVVDPRKKVTENVSSNPFGDADNDDDEDEVADRKALDSNFNPFE